MDYEEIVEKLAYEIIEDAMAEDNYEEEAEMEVTAEEIDEFIQEKIAAEKGDDSMNAKIVAIAKANGIDPAKLTEAQVASIVQTIQKQQGAQEKAASYFQEAQFMKEAAEEAYAEASVIEDAAIEALSELGLFN